MIASEAFQGVVIKYKPTMAVGTNKSLFCCIIVEIHTVLIPLTNKSAYCVIGLGIRTTQLTSLYNAGKSVGMCLNLLFPIPRWKYSSEITR